MKDRLEEESQAIEARYQRRQLPQIEQRGMAVSSLREKDRIFSDWLMASSLGPPENLKLLEIGCGAGSQLRRFLNLGFSPDKIMGCDLLEQRIAQARQRLPEQIKLFQADALKLEIPDQTFDIVFQSTVFSSILSDEYRSALAERMWRLVRPGGGVLWYDFIYNNPSNPDVRGISLSEVKRLFPQTIQWWVRRMTLLPPLARLVDPISPLLYNFLSLFPFLRSHILVWIPKQSGT